MSVSTRPFAALGSATEVGKVAMPGAMTLQILPSAAIRPIFKKQPEKADRRSSW
jgi:hypothetical protein